jgi:DNA polymerase-3 subunit gamma/tau
MALDGSHPDVIELNAAQYTGKDVMEERVLSTIRHPALMGETKTYILDECHKLSEAAQQSLLKCLEEPPSYVLFIFCTTEPRKVLETIVDRSIPFEFHPISESAICDRLGTICSAEGIAIESGARQIIAQESRGSMRRALKVLQKMGSDSISEDDAEAIVGRTSSSAALSYLGMIVHEKFRDALQFVENLRVQGKDVDGLFREVLQVLADVVRMKVDSPAIHRRSYSESEARAVSKLAEMLSGPAIRILIDVFERAIALSNVPAMPATLVAVAASTDAVSAVSNHKRKGQANGT